jgi:hypothetical protein
MESKKIPQGIQIDPGENQEGVVADVIINASGQFDELCSRILGENTEKPIGDHPDDHGPESIGI